MEPADLLINARWVAPVEPAGVVLDHHAAVVRDGRIVAILAQHDARERFAPTRTRSLARHLLIPGLVNAHTHAAMSLFKGFADDLPLRVWLEEHVWPAERRWVSDAFVRDGTRLAAAEMARGGTTCFNDMYYYPDESARAAAEVGIRAMVGLIVVGMPSVWARDADEYLAKGIEVHDRLRDHRLARTAFAPHAPYTVDDRTLERVAVLAEELDIPVHMHVHETASEVEQAFASTGERPLGRLERLGLLSPRLVAVHMTELDDHEIQRVAECGVHVVHCPDSNLKLGSGFCPLERLRAAGARLAIGTDGAASNNDLGMIAEMRSASLLAKGVSGDPAALPAAAALEAATLGGARALGLDTEIGSLAPGKAADLVAIDLDRAATRPVYDPVSQLVYAASREQVSDVWVAGAEVVRDGRVTTVEDPLLRASAEQWHARIVAGGMR